MALERPSDLAGACHATRARDPLASSDLLAARRYAYGKAAADDGDFAAAAEMFEQALERAPDWPPAWFALGEAREKLGEVEPAAVAFKKALETDPSDVQGAAARLAHLGWAEPSGALPQAYVMRLFDGYASRFDDHLTKELFYRGPALIADALEIVAPGRRFASALDIGCGTGLMGEVLRERADHLAGVDLSPAMIAKARGRGIYDGLEAAEATDSLTRSAPGAFDLILAADALCYFGDLAPVFAACRRALAEAGLLAFWLETFDGEGFRLAPTMRFAHAGSYVERTARASRLRPLLVRRAPARREAGAETPGLICVLGPTA